MISAIEAVDGKMTMVAEIYVNACVVCGEGKRVRSGSAFCIVRPWTRLLKGSEKL